MSPRSLTLGQQTLSTRRLLSPVPFLLLETTDGGTFGFSDTGFVFSGQQYQPFLERIEPYTESMLHLQDPGLNAQGQLYRDLRFTLRNGEYDQTVRSASLWQRRRLLPVLQGFNLELAKVTISQLLVDRFQYPEGEQTAIEQANAAGETPVVFYRGEVAQVERATSEEISFLCSSIQPRGGLGNGLVLNNDLTNGVLSIGRRHHVVYGDVKRVPANSVNRITETTTASVLAAEGTTVEVTDGSRLPPSGTAVIGGEFITYAQVTGTTVSGIVRGVNGSQASMHASGERFFALPSQMVLSAGLNISSVTDLLFLNPVNQAYYSAPSLWSQQDEVDSSTGQAFRSVRMTTTDLITSISNAVEQALITQQAEYDASGGTPNEQTNDRTPSGTLVNEPTSLSVDRGDWAAGPVWSFDFNDSKRQGSVAYQAGDFTANRIISRYRLFLKWRLDSVSFVGTGNPGKITVSLYAPDIPGFGLTTFATEKIDLSPLPTPPVETDRVFSPWVSPETNDVLEDSLVGEVLTLIAKAGNGDLLLGDQLGLTVTEYGLQIETVAQNVFQERLVDATIDGVAGAFGSESQSLVDVQGPLVPPITTEIYDFDDETGWGGAGNMAVSGTGDPLTFTLTLSLPPATYDIASAGTTDNWQPRTIQVTPVLTYTADAESTGRGALQVDAPAGNPGDQFGFDKNDFASLDLSGGEVLVDLYLVTAFPFIDYDWVIFRFFDSGGSMAQYQYLQADLTFNQWSSYAMDTAHLVLDNGIDWTDVTELRFDVQKRRAPSLRMYFNRISIGTGTFSQGGLIKTIPSTNMSAAGDAYLLDCVFRNVSNSFNFFMYISDDPTLANRRTLIWDDFAFVEGQRAKVPITRFSDDGVFDLTDVQRIQVNMTQIDLQGPAPEIDVYGLEREDSGTIYTQPAGSLIEHPVDVVRYHLREACRLSEDAIDETSFSEAATNLGSNKVSCVATLMAENDSDFLTYLGQQHRLQLIQVDRDEPIETVYRVLTADSSYQWAGTPIPLTQFECELSGFPSSSLLVNRRAFLYDQNYVSGSSVDAFRRALNVSAERNDLDPSLTTLLQDSETAYGPRIGVPLAFVAIADEDTAKDVAEFYTREILRTPATYDLREIPWVEGYAIERGDIVSFLPPWLWDAVDTNIKGRVIEVTKDWGSERVSLVVVEVP